MATGEAGDSAEVLPVEGSVTAVTAAEIEVGLAIAADAEAIGADGEATAVGGEALIPAQCCSGSTEMGMG